uniref:Uncharacterized protein n=1 Tax=Setaria italica TaxID=4555 RepID=K3YKD9_SETIT
MQLILHYRQRTQCPSFFQKKNVMLLLVPASWEDACLLSLRLDPPITRIFWPNLAPQKPSSVCARSQAVSHTIAPSIALPFAPPLILSELPLPLRVVLLHPLHMAP